MPGTEFFGEEEKNEVMDVLSTGILFRYNYEEARKGIWKSKELEDEVRSFTGAPYALAVSSGSTAVHCALAAAGVGYGDEIIVPPFTYVAPIESVLLSGAIPVFAEIDESLCLTAQTIKKVITENTKAVLLVHMCGAAADLDEIVALCKEKKIILIEDAGQALGAFYKGKSVGLFGKTGAFSFDFFKITTAGEGGVFISQDQKCYHLADSFSDHGHDHIGENRGMEQHPIIGFNYRMGELNAAIGLAQMRKINEIRYAKRQNKYYIKNQLKDIKQISFRRMADESGDSGTFLNFFMPTQVKAQQLMNRLYEKGIFGCNYWFTNMFHFINQWQHIKNLDTASPIAAHQLKLPQNYNTLELPYTQQVIGRLVSVGIKGKWSEDALTDYASNLKETIKEVLN